MADVKYTMGAVDAVALLRFRTQTIKYPGIINDASLMTGECSVLVDIMHFLITNFSQPISEALRQNGLYPTPRWPPSNSGAARAQAIVTHVYSSMHALCPGWTPILLVSEFMHGRALVAARIASVLDMIKRLIAFHNGIVHENRANGLLPMPTNQVARSPLPPVDESADEEPDKLAATTARLETMRDPRNWLATEFFNPNELALYRDQLQASLSTISTIAAALQAESLTLRNTLKFLDSRCCNRRVSCP
ncbi:hypothetical protein T492DRAFT_1029863 [Pavlovales sp. CCMP2436]|nr:hypothetical protein T492DRAFT_1029863 [Pavlovales sp. CCMP2436]